MKKLPEGRIFNQLLKINFVPLLTAIFKRDLFMEVSGVSEHMEVAEDYDLFVKLSCLTKFRAVQEVVSYYRLHNNNTSIVKQEQYFSEISEIINRYFPDKAAISGLAVHNTVFSISKIRNGELIKGMMNFIRHGSIAGLGHLIVYKFF